MACAVPKAQWFVGVMIRDGWKFEEVDHTDKPGATTDQGQPTWHKTHWMLADFHSCEATHHTELALAVNVAEVSERSQELLRRGGGEIALEHLKIGQLNKCEVQLGGALEGCSVHCEVDARIKDYEWEANQRDKYPAQREEAAKHWPADAGRASGARVDRAAQAAAARV